MWANENDKSDIIREIYNKIRDNVYDVGEYWVMHSGYSFNSNGVVNMMVGDSQVVDGGNRNTFVERLSTFPCN